MKKWIIIITAVLLTAGTGLAVPVIINSERGGTEKTDILKVKPGMQTDVPEPSAPPVYETDAGAAVKATPEEVKDRHEIKATDKPGASGKYTPVPSSPAAVQTAVTENAPAYTPAPSPAREPPEDWVEAKIQRHRDEIDPGDLSDFRRIYPKVDQGYIESLAGDGYTEEEMNQIKAYLKSMLGGDYERAKELFYKYSYLLSEDE